MNIYDYEDFRRFLKEKFEALKKQDPKFSHRVLANKAGIKSPSFLLSVMDGKSNLTRASAKKVAAALDLDKDESFYFENLVLLNQSEEVEERQYFAAQILKSKSYRRMKPLAASLYQYLTHWYYVAIKEMADLPDFEGNGEWISKRLDFRISAAEANRALEELINLGLIRKDRYKGIVTVSDVVATPDDVTSAFVPNFHEELIKLALESIRNCPRELRDISGTTFRVAPDDIDKIKDVVQRFRKEILEIVINNKNAEGVYQLNVQLFPLVKFKYKIT